MPQLGSESEAFLLAMSWAAAAPGRAASVAARKQALYGIVGRCVRIGIMQLAELEKLDQTPEVGAPPVGCRMRMIT